MHPNNVDELELVAVAELPMKGSVILSSLEQPLNAPEPMLVTELGTTIVVSEEQFLNAELLIIVKVPGRVILVIVEHPENAELPILVTGRPPIYAGIFTVVPVPL